MTRFHRRAGLAAVLGVVLVVLLPVAPAAAHDSTTTAYAEVTGTGVDVNAVLELEYDLLMKSAWLYAEAYEATARAEQLRQLELNADAVADYVVDRFQVSHDGRLCEARPSGPADLSDRSGRTFAVLTIAYDCDGPSGGVHAIFSALFPDGEKQRPQHEDDRPLRRRRPAGFGRPGRRSTPGRGRLWRAAGRAGLAKG